MNESQKTIFDFVLSSNNLEQFQKRIDSDDQLKRYLGEEIANQILVSTTYTAVINDILTALIASKKQQTAFETYKVCTILRQLTVNNSQFIPALYTSYELYAEGYFFMETIGVQYGLSFTNTYFDFFEWEKLAESDKQKSIQNVFPSVQKEATKIMHWLTNKKIKITGRKGKDGLYAYIDLRTDYERLTSYDNQKIKSKRKEWLTLVKMAKRKLIMPHVGKK